MGSSAAHEGLEVPYQDIMTLMPQQLDLELGWPIAVNRFSDQLPLKEGPSAPLHSPPLPHKDPETMVVGQLKIFNLLASPHPYLEVVRS